MPQTLKVQLAAPKQHMQHTLGPSHLRSSTQNYTNTPTPKAKKTDFTKEIRSMYRDHFASKRLPRPNSLEGLHSSSHITAVLQGLCASMKAHEAWDDISAHDKLSRHFIDYIAQMQNPHNGHLEVSKIQRLFKPTDDPTTYLHQVLRKIHSPYIENAYQLRFDYSITCKACAANCEVERTHEKSWTLHLTAQLTDPEKRYRGLPSRNLMDLLRDKLRTPSRTACPGKSGATCSSVNAQKSWLGLAFALENIVFGFNQSTRCKVYLPLEQDFAAVVRATGEKTRYRLVTVVKKLQSGMFAAFVHAEDGKWWRALDRSVKEVNIEEFQGERGGDAILAFYEQLDE